MLELEDMPLVYAAADVLLFPSYQENCPLAPLEAAACGLPVVSGICPNTAFFSGIPTLKPLQTGNLSI
jgi:glycosyltransferase involved in cell wall biosynthesis